ncbi:hypothetical protein FACS1894156_3740 [Bacteroidia bacterium]|nr:hypothetical protein FACS1894156_3740 [Bacteroidia bacterium]
MAMFAVACSPQEFDGGYDMGTPDGITPDKITFSATPQTEISPNVIVFANTSGLKMPLSVQWDLGNGATAKGDKVTGVYPMAGDYTVTMTVYAPDGSMVVKIYDFTIENDDFGLVSSPAYVQLTGGIDNASGKTWVFDRYNNFAAQVAAASGKNVKGHTGLGPQNSYGQEWWGAGPSEKSAWTMYDMKFTFIQSGTQLKIEGTGGIGYGRNASAAGKGGYTVNSVDGDDAIFTFAGGNYSFSIDESGDYPALTLSGDAMLGYYAGEQTYEIFYQSDSVMALRVNNTTEGQDWVFVYCLDRLNVDAPAPPPPPKEVKAVPLFEDFEGDPTVAFEPGDMGRALVWANPAPVPINPSNKVFLYEKSNQFYSNLSFTADYKFDLTSQNKIKVKVFIPSYNDYTTENGVAGDWINNKKLLPQLAVKLQNSAMGGNAWETQTEIVEANLDLNKWLELTFDFSAAAATTNYDRIVIQFGAEGHSGAGIFFFDDFSFQE